LVSKDNAFKLVWNLILIATVPSTLQSVPS
jgi:hypothetical protein